MPGDKSRFGVIEGGRKIEAEQAEPYGLSEAFERDVLYLLCNDREYYDAVGEELDGVLMGLPFSRAVLMAARQAQQLAGKGPGRVSVVMEQMVQLRRDGKVTQEEISALGQALDAIEDSGKLPEREQNLAILVPTLQRRGHKALVNQAIEEYGRRGDFAHIQERLEALRTLGEKRNSMGTILGRATFEGIAESRSLEVVETGFPDVDIALGGLRVGTVTMLTAGPGAGKSMLMSQMAGFTALAGEVVLTVTIGDLTEAMQGARFVANVTDTSIDVIEGSTIEENMRRLEPYLEGFGYWEVKEFRRGVTTVADIRDWFHRTSDRLKRPVKLGVIDYLNKIGVEKSAPRHQELDFIVDEFLEWVHADPWMCVLAANQPKTDAMKPRKKIQGKVQKHGDMDDASGQSSGIIKNVDVGMFVDSYETERGDGGVDRELGFFFYKNRFGDSRFSLGPYPTAFEKGRGIDLRALQLSGVPGSEDE